MPHHNHLKTPPPPKEGIWDYTQKGWDHRAALQALREHAGAKPRHAISRDMPINGGIYEGAYGGEAIVVDKDTYPEGHREAMDRVMRGIVGPDRRIKKSFVMECVFNTVKSMMRYDQAVVDKIFQEQCNSVDGTKVALDTYIAAGAGVCRHQALFVGSLLEDLKSGGIVSGTASVERNKLQRDEGDKFDGHSWVRYTNSAGEVFIIDVAQGRLDTLDNLMKARREGDKTMWDYARPEDHERARAKVAIQTIERADQWGVAQQQPNEGWVAAGSVVQEYDDDGLIKMPDWVQAGLPTREAQQASHHQNRAQHASGGGQQNAQRVVVDNRQEEKKKTPAQETTAKFWNAHKDCMAKATSAIDRASMIDPCFLAGEVKRSIESMKEVPGLNPEMVRYLNTVIDLCDAIYRSGRDDRSEYYGNQQAGLIKVKEMIEAIK